MTEEEAKTKWCPHVRHYNARFQPCGNSMAGAMPDHRRDGWPNNCIGSACMAWRQEKVYLGQGQSTVNGWCGLAVRP